MRGIQGYYRYPTVHGDTVVFVSEDDLFAAPVGGGPARRLTASPGRNLAPRFSPDGRWLAYSSRDEGQTEVWVMPGEGGEARRLTFTGSECQVVGWTPDGREVIFASAYGAPFHRQEWLWTVPVEGGPLRRLPWGPATELAAGGPGGAVVLGRNTRDPARWKRYRGGTVGQLWVDPDGSGEFRRLALEGNLASPMWVGERLFFLSDQEGHGNLYSVALRDGDAHDLQRHTDHQDFYVRHPSTDGARIAYQTGGSLHLLDPAAGRVEPVEVAYATARAERQRRFVDAGEYLQGFDLHPKGHSLAVIARGGAFAFGNWEGPVQAVGEASGVRQRLARWLRDGERLVMVTDEPGEEVLAVHRVDGAESPRLLGSLSLGRITSLTVSPTEDRVVVTNHRHELWLVDLTDESARQLDAGEYGPVGTPAFSPDGRWLAYAHPLSAHTSAIRVAEVATGTLHTVTRPVLTDWSPAWDPKGELLYLLSARVFEPVHDSMHFDLGFPKGQRPYAITLRADVPHPFIPRPRPLKEDKEKDKEKDERPVKAAEGSESGRAGAPDGPAPRALPATEPAPAEARAPEGPQEQEQAEDDDGEEAPKPVEIDFEGIEHRMVPFPLPEGRYDQIAGLEGKVLLTAAPVEGAGEGDELEGLAVLYVYDFERQQVDELVGGVSRFRVSLDGSTLAYRAGDALRVLPAGEKPGEEEGGPSRRSGWIELSRLRVSVDPVAEWRQMYREAWRLQRDHFWNPSMSGVDWQAVFDRYLPLLDRVGTRSEFSDLMWEMQGELGTSHAYEFGGDYRAEPTWGQGLLGADLAWDDAAQAWRVDRILQGDSWDEVACSPLARPGLGLKEGDLILAVGGRRLSRKRPPNDVLVHQAGLEVSLTVRRGDEKPRTVPVRTLGSEMPLRYRDWVEANRARVHAATGGRVGYVHVPDMGEWGYAEFHRGFLPESERDGLIIDVRHNGGGHVSQLLLEKLMRRRVGYDQPRHGRPVPFPQDSPAGPMVCLTDELAGSDGDVFSHCFKLLKLGPLIGRRTWGGVIGIWPRHTLIDGGITTQPEFAFWFEDVGWAVENYGTEPDLEVEIRPQEWARGEDPQLETAIREALAEIGRRPPKRPEFGAWPNLAAPKLPPRAVPDPAED